MASYTSQSQSDYPGIFVSAFGLLPEDVLFLQNVLDVTRNLQLLRGNQHEAVSLVAAHGRDQRVYRASELEVSAEADRESCKSSLFTPDRQEVRERLRLAEAAAAERDFALGYGSVTLGMDATVLTNAFKGFRAELLG